MRRPASTSMRATRWSRPSSRWCAPRAAPGADAEIGGFGGLFDLKAAGFTDPILVAANDGVGSKVKIAIETGRHSTIGIDLVAMCVNDLVVQGAEPLFFLDYFATAKLEPACRRRDRRRHRRRLPRGRRGADRRRDRRDAGPLCRQGLRPRRIRGRRGGTRHPAAAGCDARRRDPRPALLRRSFQRLFAGPPHRRTTPASPGPTSRRSTLGSRGPRRCAARADAHLRQAAARRA